MAYTSHSHDSGERRPSNEDGLRSTPRKRTRRSRWSISTTWWLKVPTMRHWWNDPLWAAFLNKHRFQAINHEDYQKRGDSKRCNALARLEHRKPAHPDVVSSVGRVDFFLRATSPLAIPNSCVAIRQRVDGTVCLGRQQVSAQQNYVEQVIGSGNWHRVNILVTDTCATMRSLWRKGVMASVVL
jgi:hypothetical protein